MRRVSLVLAALLLSSQAQAGLYTDDMTRCLVANTTPQDKMALVRWVFGMMGRHPDVADLFVKDEAKRDELNRATAKLFERLLTEACRKQTEEAVRYEGVSAIGASFKVLGNTATVGLMSDKAVANTAEDTLRHIDMQKLAEIFRPKAAEPKP